MDITNKRKCVDKLKNSPRTFPQSLLSKGCVWQELCGLLAIFSNMISILHFGKSSFIIQSYKCATQGTMPKDLLSGSKKIELI